MRFVCLGYAAEKTWDELRENELGNMLEECLAYDDVLRKNGHWVPGGQALQSAQAAKTLRFKGGKVVVTDGPYAETKEQIGGFLVLEARDIDDAVELMSKHPGVRFGPFEIRPAAEGMSAEMNAAGRDGPATAPSTKECMRFLCLGYMDEKRWGAMPKAEQEAFMRSCLAYDEVLRKNGHWVGGEALQGAGTAKTLRWQGGKVVVTDGPYAETKEQLGGVVALQARDLNQVIELMSRHPGVPLGIHLEIRPADQEFNALKEARRQREPALQRVGSGTRRTDC